MQQLRNELYLTRLIKHYEALQNNLMVTPCCANNEITNITTIKEWQSVGRKISEAPNTSLKCSQIILDFAIKYAEMNPANNNLAENSIISVMNYLNNNLSTPK